MTQKSVALVLWASALCCTLGAAQAAPSADDKLVIARIAQEAKAQKFKKVLIKKDNHYATWPTWLSFQPRLQYQFSFDPSAIYLHPDLDQNDYNKLPGVSDCGALDLQVHGAMFAWRWQPDLQKLQITAYANRDGVHQAWNLPKGKPFMDQVQLVELEASDLRSFAPLTYSITLEPLLYRFSIRGTLPSGRVVSSDSVLPRTCSGHPWVKQGSTLYFGGTKVAPHNVTGHVKWLDR